MYGFGLLDVVTVAESTGRDLTEVAGVYFVAVRPVSGSTRCCPSISELPREDRWQTLARMALRYDLYAALGGADPRGADLHRRIAVGRRTGAVWEHGNSTAITRARNSMGEFDDSRADLAALSVLLRQIRTLVHTAGA